MCANPILRIELPVKKEDFHLNPDEFFENFQEIGD
jgi:hypothetical protein